MNQDSLHAVPLQQVEPVRLRIRRFSVEENVVKRLKAVGLALIVLSCCLAAVVIIADADRSYLGLAVTALVLLVVGMSLVVHTTTVKRDDH